MPCPACRRRGGHGSRLARFEAHNEGSIVQTSLCVGCRALGAAVVSLCVSSAAFAAIPPYTLAGSYALPASGPYAVGSDGRLLVMRGSTVLRQSAANSASFEVAGSVDASLISSFGASFLSVSPDGSTLAIGDGNFSAGASVHFVRAADLSASAPAAVRSVVVGNASAAWLDNSTLFVSGADPSFNSQVARVSVTSLTSDVVINGIGGASGGVAVRGGRLYTGNGFTFNAPGVGSRTGDVKAFDLSAFGASPVNFEASGVTVARALSAASLGFDGVGNLLIGGGDLFTPGGDRGAAVVVDGDAVAAALAGGGIAPVGSTLRLSPAGDVFYGVAWNEATQELLVVGDGTVFRYAVPAPGVVAVFAVASAANPRRRRHG